jgi:hypothetical protein
LIVSNNLTRAMTDLDLSSLGSFNKRVNTRTDSATTSSKIESISKFCSYGFIQRSFYHFCYVIISLINVNIYRMQ